MTEETEPKKKKKKKKTVGYIDNEKFLGTLIEFQKINDDVSEWYERIRDDNKVVKDAKRKLRNERIVMLDGENPVQKRMREQRLSLVKNDLGNSFLKIAEGLLKQPKFINYDYHRKQEMISDATYFMVNYIDRYDTNRTNPFAYFTQIAFHAFLQSINKTNKRNENFTSITYIENLDGGEQDDEWD
jgi:hypothetical protein